MCGIAGYMQQNGEAAEAPLAAQLHTLAHRGPDDTGHSLEGPTALGHARLSIIDPGGGHQSLFSPDGNLFTPYAWTRRSCCTGSHTLSGPPTT